MKSIDKEVLADYNAGVERGRLREGIGRIEFERTKELLKEYLPKPPAVVYDIGGGYGEYAWWLASIGYEVHLFDLSERNIAMSKELKEEYPNCSLTSAEVCDARNVNRGDNSADAILLMGPLYHIVDKDERILAIKECKRLLKNSGILFTAGITPYATLLWATTVFGIENRLIEENAFIKMVERELSDGEHIKPSEKDSNYRGIGRSHFHSPQELKSELLQAGFAKTRIHGVVGSAWLAPNLDELLNDEKSKKALMKTVRLIDEREDIIGLSTHILGVSVL